MTPVEVSQTFVLVHLKKYIYMWCIVKYGTHSQNWCSAFNPSKCTHTAVSSEHTHCEHTPRAVGSHCSSPGSNWGSVPCSRAPQSWYWRWGECHSHPHLQPCQTWDSNPQPLDCKSDSLTIRPHFPGLSPERCFTQQGNIWYSNNHLYKCLLKVIVLPKMIFLSSFTHLHVFPKHKWRNF